MVNKKFILALSAIVLGLCGTSAAMVESVITAQGSQDQSAVPADVVKPNLLLQHMEVVFRRIPTEPNIRTKIIAFCGIKDAKDAFSEFKSHAAEFNYDLASRYDYVALPPEIESLFTQLKGIYNKLESLDLFSVVDSITPVGIEAVLKGINVYRYSGYAVHTVISAIQDTRDIARVILRLINNDTFILLPEARAVLDSYYCDGAVKLDTIENKIKAKQSLTEEEDIFLSKCIGVFEGRRYGFVGDALCVRAHEICQFRQI